MSVKSTSQPLYREIFRARIKSSIAMANAVREIPHPGMLGEIREALVRELFRPLLPADIGVGTGQLIDSHNNVSPQTDIILFDRSLAPPMMLSESLGLFPIESCLYVIEIKSTLDSKQLRKSHASALAITRLIYKQIGQYYHVRYALFAFSSDLTDTNECQRYQDFYENLSGYSPIDASGRPYLPPIRALCVVGREYGHERDGKWTGKKHNDDACNEVLLFIGGIVNTYRDIAKSRQPIRMEDYVFPEDAVYERLSPRGYPPCSV